MEDIKAIEYFANLITKELGIVYSSDNLHQLERRLIDIAKQLGFSSVQKLREGSVGPKSKEIVRMVLDLATNHETSFFRDPALFKAIEEKIIPYFLEKNRLNLNIWCSACSYGQEPYSIAIILDRISKGLKNFNFNIVATDVSLNALLSAQYGIYDELQINRGLDRATIEQYFEIVGPASDKKWQIKSEIRKKIKFMQLNLLHNYNGFGPFDIVLCRNVLIYQAVEAKKSVIQKISNVMKPDSYLILGAAESLIGLSDQFSMIRHERATSYLKGA